MKMTEATRLNIWTFVIVFALMVFIGVKAYDFGYQHGYDKGMAEYAPVSDTDVQKLIDDLRAGTSTDL